jgi:hypothetical protein
VESSKQDVVGYILGSYRCLHPLSTPLHIVDTDIYGFALFLDYGNKNEVTKADFMGASKVFGSPKHFVANVRHLEFDPVMSSC